MNVTKFKLDPNKPPKLSRAAQERFDAIQDDDIDYTDIAELDASIFEKKNKTRINVRFDADVVDWFKSYGTGYQTRMNAVLRAFYELNRER